MYIIINYVHIKHLRTFYSYTDILYRAIANNYVITSTDQPLIQPLNIPPQVQSFVDVYQLPGLPNMSRRQPAPLSKPCTKGYLWMLCMSISELI